jgi:hypothetical protein
MNIGHKICSLNVVASGNATSRRESGGIGFWQINGRGFWPIERANFAAEKSARQGKGWIEAPKGIFDLRFAILDWEGGGLNNKECRERRVNRGRRAFNIIMTLWISDESRREGARLRRMKI